jgi:hypothetical protein
MSHSHRHPKPETNPINANNETQVNARYVYELQNETSVVAKEQEILKCRL